MSVDTTAPQQSLRDRFAEVRARVARAAARAGRPGADVMTVAVTKFAEPDQIRELIQLGHRDFGESRVQHLIQRASMVQEWESRQRVMPHVAAAGGQWGAEQGVRWHLIGHLQRNKVRRAVEFCRLIHSVDSLRLAEEIQQVAMKREQMVDVLVQVNCSGERGKFGCPAPAAAHLAAQIDTMMYVRVRGLMTMAPLVEDPGRSAAEARATFGRARELFEEMQRAGAGEGEFNILSMGMSGDFEIAIEEGANMVRIGTAIFGEGGPREPESQED